jgi:hypothetical protein
MMKLLFSKIVLLLFMLVNDVFSEVDLSHKLLALYHKSDGVYTEGKNKCEVYKKSEIEDFNEIATIEQREKMLFTTLNFITLDKKGGFRVYTFFVIEGVIQDNSINGNKTLSLELFERLIKEEKKEKAKGKAKGKGGL